VRVDTARAIDRRLGVPLCALVTLLRRLRLLGARPPRRAQFIELAEMGSAVRACSPCVSAANHRRTPCTDNRCMRAIEAEQVLAIVRARVGGRLRGD